jgi:hypothetical protein
VKAFNRRSHVEKNSTQTSTAPYNQSTIFDFFNTEAATMKRFSSNITGLSPVTKKTSPTKVYQEKAKEGAKQDQPWIVQGVKKTYKQQQNTKNSNYKQQLITNKIYSSTVSSVGPPSLFPKVSVRESRNR